MQQATPAPAEDRVADVVRASVSSGEIAGAAFAVTTKRMARMEAFGVHNQAAGSPVELDTIFRLGSAAKPIHSAAALSLIEDRNIDLAQGVTKWLPELADHRVLRTPTGDVDDTVPASREITVFDVLTFQQGIGIYLYPQKTPLYEAMHAAGVAPVTEPVPFGPDEFMARLATVPFAHQPGETFMYHTGDDILRVLIARIAGKPLYQVLQERIFEPLAMMDSGSSVPQSKHHRFSTCYFPRKEPGAALEPWDEADGRFAQEPIFPNQLMSTLSDFTSFAHMLLNQGDFRGRRVLKPESVALMMTDHLSAEQKQRSPAPEGFWQTRGWGMGATVFSQSMPQGPSAGSYRWFGGYGPQFVIDPKRGSCTIIMIPRLIMGMADTQLGNQFETLAYSDLIGAEPLPDGNGG